MGRTPVAPLLPILRSNTQGDLLALLYLHPEREYSLVDAATALGVGTKRVHDEVNRLAAGGLVTQRRRANMRLIAANLDTPIARALTDLILATYGPVPVLREALAEIEGIHEAHLYGSWAARYAGEAGRVPNDVDLLIVGNPDRDEVYQAIEHAQLKLGRDVQVTYLNPTDWEDADHPFVRELSARPLVTIRGDTE